MMNDEFLHALLKVYLSDSFFITTSSCIRMKWGESSGLVVRRRSQEVRHLSSIPASPKCLVPRIQKGANTQAVSGSALAVSFREL